MSRIKILIVDDSKLVQEVLKSIFACDPDIEVVGVADNGAEAVEKVKRLHPDFVTADISMPVMDGLEAIEHIMRENPTPILVISDIRDSNVAFVALSRGALEVVPKSEIQPEKAENLIRKIKMLAKVKVIRHIGHHKDSHEPAQNNGRDGAEPAFQKVVAIACSTGGPRALAAILSSIPVNFPFPILIAQHMDEGFIAGLASWLRETTPLTIREAKGGESIKPGVVYLSPATRHMTVDARGRIVLVDIGMADIYRPSCNRLLLSAAAAFKADCIGVILTGMGDDGVSGMKSIRENGGITIAQDEATSIVFGMPGVAVKNGCIDKILPLEEIGPYLKRMGNSYIKHPAQEGGKAAP